MSQTTNYPHNEIYSDRVYGFIDQTTNVFYAFESYEEYHSFLLWMQEQSAPSSNNTPQKDILE